MGIPTWLIIDELVFCIVVDEFEFCDRADGEMKESWAVKASARTNIARPVLLFIIFFLLGMVAVCLSQRERSGDGDEWMQQPLCYFDERLRKDA